MRNFLISLLVFTYLSSEAEAKVPCAVAREALATASSIRNLTPVKEVPCIVQSKPEIREFISVTIKEEVFSNRMNFEERIFKKLRLIPTDYNYTQGLSEIYLSQIAGYYDVKAKHYVMADWWPKMLQPAISVHELTHALQDQHFNLEKFIDQKTSTTDSILARSALVEGDATAVMLDYTSNLAGGQKVASLKSTEKFLLQNLFFGGLSMGAIKAPESLKFIISFPYSSGFRFAHNLLNRNGYQSLTEAFKNPPLSTEQILHPKDKYPFEAPKTVEAHTAHLPEGSREIFRDTLGEFITSLVLTAFNQDRVKAANAAAGWGGDTIVLYKLATPDRGDIDVVVWNTVWDTKNDAQEFCDAFKFVDASVYCEDSSVRVTFN